MKQIEYNLLEERWVRVRGQDYTVQEVSLPDALLHAHEYRDLAGELPTQDAAMLRLLANVNLLLATILVVNNLVNICIVILTSRSLQIKLGKEKMHPYIAAHSRHDWCTYCSLFYWRKLAGWRLVLHT